MRRVLVVDDDPDVGRALQLKLQAEQRYAVTVATSGREALQLVLKDRPDLVLCDIDMPGMDGVTLAETLGLDPATKAMPLLFLSALVTPADVKRGVSAGDHPMLSKHSPVADLVKAIDAALGAPKA